MEKKCTLCHVAKPVDEFNRNKSKRDGLSNVCRACAKLKSQTFYVQNGEKVREANNRNRLILRKENQKQILSYLLEHPCVVCGMTDVRCLEFAHRDRATKEKDISLLIRVRKWESVLVEIEKCDVMCANCHRIETSKENNSYRHLAGLR